MGAAVSFTHLVEISSRSLLASAQSSTRVQLADLGFSYSLTSSPGRSDLVVDLLDFWRLVHNIWYAGGLYLDNVRSARYAVATLSLLLDAFLHHGLPWALKDPTLLVAGEWRAC